MATRAKRAGAGRGTARAPPAEQEEPRPPLDVSTLLEQDRLRQVEDRLEASQAAYDKLCADHQRLQERQQREEQEAYDVAALFRRDMLAKQQQLAEAQHDAARGAQQLVEARAMAMAREAQLEAAHEQERQQLQGELATLHAQLAAVAEFRQQRDGLEAELQRMRLDNARIEQEAQEKVRELQRQLYDLEHGGDSGIASAEAWGAGASGTTAGSQGDDSDLFLEADLQRLLAHNRKVADQMRQYGKEAEELQAEMKALEAERADLLRDVSLRDQLEQQYAKRGTMQAREIRDAHTRIGALERGLEKAVADFEAEKASLAVQLAAQEAEAAAEREVLQRLLRARTKEVRQVRRLAQQVLLQRSDVEAFLVSSIHHVRGEIAAGAAGKGARQPQMLQRQQLRTPLSLSSASISARGNSAAGFNGEAAPFTGPSAGQQPRCEASSSVSTVQAAASAAVSSPQAGGEASSSLPGSSGSGSSGPGGSLSLAAISNGGSRAEVDVSSMSWPEREHVLRLLFAKIFRAAERAALPPSARLQALSEVQAEVHAPTLRGLATEAGPAGLA